MVAGSAAWRAARGMVHDALMMERLTPTWKLVLDAAGRLAAVSGEFRLQDLVVEVQRADSGRGRSTIQPVVQGMTANAGSGPPSPCGKPLLRTGRGRYTLSRLQASQSAMPADGGAAAAVRPADGMRRSRAARDAEVATRVESVIATFTDCLDAYDRLVPFRRAGQYETHRAAIDRRRHVGSAGAALADDEFLTLLYQTLRRWGIGVRASRLAPLPEFRRQLRAHAGRISALDGTRIDDPALDVPAAAQAIWSIVANLGIVANISVIVPGTKTLHHLLPDLVPPMDRAWTGAFFRWSAAAPQSGQAATFEYTFNGLASIARAAQPACHVGGGWRTSPSKVLDNAIIGYCAINKIPPVRA
ncbi:MAG: DUF7669 domain-containing protein [Streptosporangiaceae bacterium]